MSDGRQDFFTRSGFGRGGGPHSMIGRGTKPRNLGGAARRLWRYLSGYRSGLLSVVAFVGLTSGFGVLGPFLMGRAIDTYIIAGDIPGLVKIVLVMAAVYMTGSLTTWLQTYLMVGVSQRSLRDLRGDLFGKLQTLSLRFFDKRHHGELMSRLSNDIENINNVLTQSVTQLIGSVLTTVGVMAMMFGLNWKLAVVSLVILPLMVLLTKVVAAKTRRNFREQQKHLGELNGVIEETVTGQRVVLAYSRQEETIRRFDDCATAQCVCRSSG